MHASLEGNQTQIKTGDQSLSGNRKRKAIIEREFEIKGSSIRIWNLSDDAQLSKKSTKKKLTWRFGAFFSSGGPWDNPVSVLTELDRFILVIDPSSVELYS